MFLVHFIHTYLLCTPLAYHDRLGSSVYLGKASQLASSAQLQHKMDLHQVSMPKLAPQFSAVGKSANMSLCLLLAGFPYCKSFHTYFYSKFRSVCEIHCSIIKASPFFCLVSRVCTVLVPRNITLDVLSLSYPCERRTHDVIWAFLLLLLLPR